MMKAPIVVFAYNRPKHLRLTIEALQRNFFASESDLFVFSDGPANEHVISDVNKVRSFLRTITGFKRITIIERQNNFGLGYNIISGVTEIIDQFGRIIVLEDDLITAPFFLQYMNSALDLYAENNKVISIHGYVYPVKQRLPETFFMKGADCFGWATWKRGWDNFEADGQSLLDQLMRTNQIATFDFNNAYPFTQMLKDQIAGRNSSWAVRWYASAFLKGMFTLYPGRSLIHHNGGDDTGTHTGYDDLLNVTLSDRPVNVEALEVGQNWLAYEAFESFLRKLAHPGLLYRLKRKWKKIKP